MLRWNLRKSRGLNDQLKERVEKKLQRKLTENGEILLRSDRFRDRGKNTADCLEKLRELLIAALRVPKKRTATQPTKASVKRRQEGKKKQSDKKRDRQKVKF
jgi:ribosome-associated protein